MTGFNRKETLFMGKRSLLLVLFVTVSLSVIGRLAIAHIPFGGWDDYNETSYCGGARNFVRGIGSLWAFVNVENNKIFEVTPFLMYLLSFAFKLFGTSEFIARLVPIACSSATLVFVYLLGKMVFNKEAGIIAVSLMAANSMFNMYGFIVQTDSVFVCFMVASLYFYLKSLKEGKRSYFIISGLLSGIAVFSKQTALLAAIIVSVTEFSRISLDKRSFREALFRSSLFILLSLFISALWFMRNYLVFGMDFVKHLDGDVTLGEVSVLRMLDFIFRTFEPFYLPLILLGLILNIRKNILKLVLVFWFAAVSALLCLKNPHNYYTYPIIPVSFIFISCAILWLYGRAKSARARLAMKIFFILMIVFSSLFTYKRFLNRKIGCDEVAQLRDYCNAGSQRVVYSLSGLYKAERYYIEPQPMELKDIKDIEDGRRNGDVFIYRRFGFDKTESLAKDLAKSASFYKVIYQRKYDFFLKKRLVPIFEVLKFNQAK
jgi:4-amino-4-deoxy-L-arabinose transferase-like glycosyltransferase